MPVKSGATEKADAFCDEASALGWATEVKRNGDKVTVEATLDDKLISISWRGGACLNESYLEIDGYRRKLRNAGAARRKLAEEAEEARPEGGPGYDQSVKGKATATLKKARKPKLEPQPQSGKVVNRKFVRKKSKSENGVETKQPPPPPFKSKPKPPTLLPFDPETASDEEILEAVRGKKIVWKNRLSGNYETTRVLAFPKQNHLRIEINSSNERCLTFAEADLSDPRVPEGGFRSVRVKAITSVTK